ncbi:hypothetical protein CBR_g36682 [Chara braunii]|uniref:Reverse transcriptase/retrotransposon-derived protein RNase H-like domain-containing protein n=1 Tax=Chara braunii TaxID=69332 RepID=A0A388LLG6_CHABU|nr:hypothetical protein CBR_g36682 [Chara braunii]|eukprot:GBG83065.1 hypothetical protein CBR_g36682 [Chara braunii]
MVVTVDLRPGVGLGPFTLGMPVCEALAFVEQHRQIYESVDIKYCEEDPLLLDLVLSFPLHGFYLRFEPRSQRLRLIEVFDITKLQMRYATSVIGGPNIPTTFVLIYALFGPTFPGTYDGSSGFYSLFYPGLSFRFPIPPQYTERCLQREAELPLEFPDGTTPVTSRLCIYTGTGGSGAPEGKCVPPQLPVGSLYMEEVRVKLAESLFFTGGGQEIAFGASPQLPPNLCVEECQKGDYLPPKEPESGERVPPSLMPRAETNYYRKFVRNFSTIAAPLRRLLRKETIWKWDKDCTSAMKKLKQALIEYPVLKVADPSLPFVVTTDASQYDIGVVLQQDDGHGYRLVEFMSARMPSEKVVTSTYERELYALRQALEHWKHYLLGRHFKVYSDHETLRWLKTQAKMTPKLTRWAAKMDQYDFELKPVKGKYNVVADALSRRADYFGAIVHYLHIGKDLQQKIREAYALDPIYSDLLKRVQEAPATEPNYPTTEGLLFEKTRVFDRLCIPNSEEICSLILGECHDTEGHFGWQKTLANLMRAYTWPGMKNDCIEYVRSCKI